MVKLKKIRDKLSLMYWSAVAVISGTMISVQPVMADTIWNARWRELILDMATGLWEVSVAPLAIITIHL